MQKKRNAGAGSATKKPSLARKPLKKVNRARRQSEFARAYGSKARVEWVRSLGCSVPCCYAGPRSENAHIRTGGTSRKADAKWIIPLCRAHHRELHDTGSIYVMRTSQGGDLVFRRGNLESIARHTETAWQLKVRIAEQLRAQGRAPAVNVADREKRA